MRIRRRLQRLIPGVTLLTMIPAMTAVAPAQEAKPIPLMPFPAKVSEGQGRFVIDKSFTIQLRGHPDARVKHAAERFLGYVSRRSGVPANEIAADRGNFVITCWSEGEEQQKLGEDESYHLEVGAAEVHLEATTPLGVIYGLQTFRQLLQNLPEGLWAPMMVVADQPRFAWRGLLIDVSRHFMPLEVIKRNLDGMEAVKLNVLHLHLSDDQGFRVESQKFPSLHQMSSDGLFYTQEQIKELIAYARDRGVRVVPEFDMPGHTTSWFTGYPELASAPGPYSISRHFGVHDAAMDPTRDHTYHFLDRFIGEMARLFPDPYFHIGGDEVNGKQWEANAKIRKFKSRRRLKNNEDLQAYFNQRLQKIVKSHDKIMMGWDEILHADLPKDVVVQSWRGQQSLADAARQGYRGLLSYGYYLDLMEPASQHYSIDPLAGAAAGLNEDEKRLVLGGEACMWSEFVTPENIDGRIWPRAAAVAERLWSPQDVRDVDSMYVRLQSASDYLASIGLTHQDHYRTMLQRLAAPANPASLRVLADVVEPVKGYARPRARDYESTTPLDRLVDGVSPESKAGRDFAGIVQRLLAHQASASDSGLLRASLVAWRDNDAQLKAALQQSPSLQEVAPLSDSLKTVAEAGLQALDYLTGNVRPPAAWRDQQLAMLKQAQQPQAELLNMIAPSVQMLVEAVQTE